MLVKEAFKEVLTGYNMTNSLSNDRYLKECYFIQKDSIQYTNIIEQKLVKKKVITEIKDKYLMHERDIIISLKKPYKVGTYRYLNLFNSEKNIVIPNNFIILRGINMNLYSYIFVANYLEKIGIAKYVEKNKVNARMNKELTLEDIKNIELPDITKEQQMKISTLLNYINDRSAIYSTILENDDQIIKLMIDEVVGEKI